MPSPLEDAVRSEVRAQMFDLFEQTLFEICTGVKRTDVEIETANAGFAKFVKLSDALHKVFGAEWPNR